MFIFDVNSYKVNFWMHASFVRFDSKRMQPSPIRNIERRGAIANRQVKVRLAVLCISYPMTDINICQVVLSERSRKRLGPEEDFFVA